jgi:molybdopterin-containing oxidoreductase family membrane subunit
VFVAWLVPWVALLGFGVYAAYLCLALGLNQTNMDNRFAFGAWIFLDLTVIALGAGAFFTGFLLYILKRHELKAVINSAVVIGFICYSGAVVVLMVDVGQPLRAWFTFWHPNVHSMLTEVTFCITVYLSVLAIEYLPIVLKNRKLRQIPEFLVFEFQLHKVMYVLAGVGTFLSFFHQGSLGGLYGVLNGRPFVYREAFGIWPTTFFLFIISAAAAGPSFILLTTWITSKVARKPLVTHDVFESLARISGYILSAYVLLKTADTLFWMKDTAPSLGVHPSSFFGDLPLYTGLHLLEVALFGFIPMVIFLNGKLRKRIGWLVGAAVLNCMGIVVNRYLLTIQTLALPTLPFDELMSYVPSWQETGAFLMVIAYGMIVYSMSYRYGNLFPQERELQRNGIAAGR